ncbi:MAG: CaiB/BaiF CoA transferase family protein, partial [Dehalococcoidia bacterium]
GHLCGKVLGDLGADVIKIEPLGGDPSRNIGPFYRDIPHPERSLPWFAFNTSKRSLVLDLETRRGKEIFQQLVTKSDFIIESFPPGHMDALGLGYEALIRINPGIIIVSITPFGQTGPYRDFKASDLVLMAMGGQMYGAGDADRPPVRLSLPQAYLFGGIHAALGGMIALYYRQRTGQGQWVDVSIREGVLRALSLEIAFWEFNRELCPRMGPLRARGKLMQREVWACRDGEVTIRVQGGAFRSGMQPLSQWMRGEGWGGKFPSVDWGSVDILDTFSEETVSWQDEIAPFFLTRTKAELYERALRSRIPLLPCYTPREIREDRQLASRGFWVEVNHPEMGASIAYPGAPYKLALTPWRISRRPPLIGEHTREIIQELASPAPGEAAPAPGTRGSAASKKALEGIKVADFTWVLAGPLITKCLADFGATVVRVESGKRLDLTRATIPYKDGKPGPNRSGSFRLYNSSKYSLCLDLSQDRGLEVARRLVAWADVVVENFAPGTMEKMGLSYRHLRQIKPDIVMLSSSNQGQTGPHREHRGFGWNLGGLAGFNHVTGWPDRIGVAPNTAWTDFFAPWYATVSILGALDYRRRTGEGQYIDLSQYEAGLSFLSVALLEYAANGRERTRQGNRSPRAAPHGAYPCRGEDRWCVISVHTQEQWRAFSQAIGDPVWVRDPRFATLEARKEHEDELDVLVAAWTLGLAPEEVMAGLQRAGVAAGVVENAQDLLERDPQLTHRGYFQFLDHPDMGPSSHIYWPAHLSLTPAQLRYAPLLGEHTEMVCREILGMSDGEFQELRAVGVLE